MFTHDSHIYTYLLVLQRSDRGREMDKRCGCLPTSSRTWPKWSEWAQLLSISSQTSLWFMYNVLSSHTE